MIKECVLYIFQDGKRSSLKFYIENPEDSSLKELNSMLKEKLKNEMGISNYLYLSPLSQISPMRSSKSSLPP